MRINPSILSADFGNMQSELGRVRAADMIHVDVMDSLFVPNLTFGLPVVENWRTVSEKTFDVHLMIDDPDNWAPRYAEKSEMVTFHIESAKNPERIISKIREHGAMVGIAVKPNTPLEPYKELVHQLDQLLVMTVEPGFGGQKFMHEVLPKIRYARELINQDNPSCFLQVDGGINLETISLAAEAGADTFVAGSAVFGAENPELAIHQLRTAASR
jgi:ribulose-phosphate 3-epimerase